MVEAGDQLQRGARDVARCRIVDRRSSLDADTAWPGLAATAPSTRHRAALDGVAGARAAGKQAARDEQFVEPDAVRVWSACSLHRPSLAKAEPRRQAGDVSEGDRIARSLALRSARRQARPARGEP